MRAVRHHRFGPPEVLIVDEVDDPVPGPGQVRVVVGAAGVHVLDTFIRAGERGGPFPLPELPTIPGREVAGVVDAIGAGVEEGWIATSVVAHLGPASGGYAELAVAPVSGLHAIPTGLAAPDAVAMIGTGRTAFGIAEAAAIAPGDVVLVTAAAGGLGALLVQIAHRAGATVVGAAGGGPKVDVALGLGADIGVDYSLTGWTDEVRRRLDGRGVTLVLLAVGGELGRDALALLEAGGRVVIYGWSGGEAVAVTDAQRERGIEEIADLGRRIMGRPGGVRDLEDMALGSAARGEVQPLVGQIYPLADAADAHRAVETRATIGKTVLRP